MDAARRTAPRLFRLALPLAVVASSVAGCDPAGETAAENRVDAISADAVPPLPDRAVPPTDGEATPDDGPASPPDAAAPAPDASPPAESFWPLRMPPDLQNDLTREHPASCSHPSRFSTHMGPGESPSLGRRGALGVGNGHVFAFTGYAEALNTLHGMVGPTYEKHDGFFGDYRLDLLSEDGMPAPYLTQDAVRDLKAPVVLTRGRTPHGELDTLDFAPAVDDPQARRCVVRALSLRHAVAGTPLTVQVQATRPVEVSDMAEAALIEARGERRLVTTLAALDAGPAPSLSSAPGVLRAVVAPDPARPGADRTLVLAHCAYGPGESPPAGAPALDVGRLLDETTARFAAATAELARYELPDPMVSDFIEGMVQTLWVQTTSTGASCPMSEYTRTWARDNIGPGLAWLALGGHAPVRAMLDYLDAAIRYRGDLANSYDADLDPSGAPPAPDWAALPPLEGRVGAETPSYLVLLYGALTNHTGEVERPAARWGLLRRALLAQAFGPDRLLPFTGDETYRAAMNAAFGLALEYRHEALSFSANSTLLWLGAARAFVALAEATGHPEDAAAARALWPEVRASLESRYALPDGCHSPFVTRSTLEAWPAPFEDVALQVVWAGAFDGDDPAAARAMACTLQRLRVAPGELQSRVAPRYAHFPLLGGGEGIYTGMLPGYTLYALTEAGHPEAAHAFRNLERSLDTSGNAQEDHVWPSHEGLSIIYDAAGEIGDYTAKFRPWEGGINLHAALDWLSGFRPVALDRRIRFRPHLLERWPGFAARGLRAGDDRFDLVVTRAGDETGAVTVSVTSRAAMPYTVLLRWDAAAPPVVRRDGLDVDETSLVRRTHFGQHAVELEQPLPAGHTLTVEFR